ncbi:MAG: transposase family protein [Anaerolineae bacterium]|nr:transposase family protein [Anaerolineae bacterium]
MQLRPACCAGCGSRELNGHGWYERWAVYEERDVKVSVKRWRCKGCGKTTSQLPNFLHRYRHYALVVIESVLRGRLEQGQTWGELGEGGAPSQRSMRRWVGAFVAQAMTWLPAMLTVLAFVAPLLSALDPHGTKATTPAVAVLQMSDPLAVWLQPDVTSLAAQDALRVMWRWGWNTGVGRLV